MHALKFNETIQNLAEDLAWCFLSPTGRPGRGCSDVPFRTSVRV